jgi:chromosome segregation ATPase
MNFSGLIPLNVYFCSRDCEMELFTEVISEIQEKVTKLKQQIATVSAEKEQMAETIAILGKRIEEKQAELNDAQHKIEELSLEIESGDRKTDNRNNTIDQEDIEALVQEIDDCIIRLKNK